MCDRHGAQAKQLIPAKKLQGHIQLVRTGTDWPVVITFGELVRLTLIDLRPVMDQRFNHCLLNDLAQF